MGEKFLNENSTFAFADRSARVLECKNPSFDRIRVILEELEKPETLQERIEKQYPDFEVVTCDYDAEGFLYFNRTGFKDYPHNLAQSMRGFAGYVYSVDSVLYPELYIVSLQKPFCSTHGHPKAVLFKKESE